MENIEKNIIERETAAREERLKQEGTGVVSKASHIGRYKYKMRKTDF
jgi:hypothetical protein